ncbi:MAG: CPBP family intramembrane metalloprotease [Saccharofermentans sp.]|nr:CPBP family intramembrane metalloprotease [Saccharofermentans sp.]
MEGKAFRKGLSVAAIVLIAIAAVLLSLSRVNVLLYGREVAIFSVPFVAAAALPLLTVLIVLMRYFNNTDTIEEMMGTIAVRYAVFGWCFIFLIKLASALLSAFCYDFYNRNYTSVYLIMNSVNVCIIGTCVLALCLRKIPAVKIEKRPMKLKQLFLLIMMMYGITQVGSMMGLPIDTILSAPAAINTSTEEALKSFQSNLLLSSDSVVRIICVGILPAIFEELLFRKFLIDRTIRHGEFVSCAMSGIMFGLWHGNFQQFFFAFFVGVLFAFVYIRTGNIIYTMILHASMNLVTSTITLELVGKLFKEMGLDLGSGSINTDIDYDAMMSSILPLILLLLLWIIILSGFNIAGFVLFIVKRKNFKLVAREGEPPRKVILHTMTHSVTMWVFFAFALLLFVYSYAPDIVAAFLK